MADGKSAGFGRGMMRAVLFVAAAALASCKPPGFAGDPLREDRTDLAYPEIEPLAPILAGMAQDLPDPADPDPELRARGEALRARTGTAGAPQEDEAALTERGDALRARAEEIREASP